LAGRSPLWAICREIWWNTGNGYGCGFFGRGY